MPSQSLKPSCSSWAGLIPVIEIYSADLGAKAYVYVCSNELDCKSLPLHANRCVLPEANGRVEHNIEDSLAAMSACHQLDASQIACGPCGLAICSKVLVCGSSISTNRIVT